MFSTCLFCHSRLRANESIEAFPVGRRLAFDALKGRLWVVCGACGRWNLAPLEERWEAIEQCERLFRGTRIRVSTDQIGLAKLRDGTELVRIGEPLRPEFAAWRYSAQVAQRRRRNLLIAGGGVAAVTGIGAGLWAAGVGFSSFQLLQYLPKIWERRRDKRVVHRDGELTIRFGDVRNAIWLPPNRKEPARLEMNLGQPAPSLVGEMRRGTRLVLRVDDPRCHRMIALGLQRPNRFVGSRRDIDTALGWLDAFGNPLQPGGFVMGDDMGVRIQGRPGEFAAKRSDALEAHYSTSRKLSSLPGYVRLAIEMAAHEEQERRFLTLHLSVLEDAWKEAEQIAAIADDLLLPDWIRDRLGG